MHASAISPPQLKHQYIDYTNGSSIVSGQKIHVDFDYGNGLDTRWLWKALLSIECEVSIPIHNMYGEKMAIGYRHLYTNSFGKSTL